mmetsp:Transcript_6214/g.13563  ORF Transcript_6214/g.13563 Transcript_6214/m.13563 type:complete len:537 (+) Transcript_6214:103-1713(+)|eukprot:CAMPEP_0202908908 /NCGR_PEP_ID=MMETSP1392-20130828/47566_1 /ASSEMBLY_ACC=CAM_ASM_000868 /TAXON_ID=225041 /ORGANISM="Chlamydomonas chlamydogama, Strain SAG 11-48b" /LENGTH=536 /DNA_ID=CAMNT_0049598445 /DNA_START=25 /DNA_END=1635 /DNA_ORIENTATION=+
MASAQREQPPLAGNASSHNAKLTSMDSNRRISFEVSALQRPSDATIEVEGVSMHSPGGAVQRQGKRGPPRRSQSLKDVLNLQMYTFMKDLEAPTADSLLCTAGPAARRASILGNPEAGMRRNLEEGVNTSKRSSTGTASTSATGEVQEIVEPYEQLGLGQRLEGEAADSNLVAVSPHLPPCMVRTHWSIDDFDLTRHVHSGYASDVFEGTCKLSGQHVALKVYAVDNLDEIPRVQLAREVRLHSRCKHENVIQFYTAFMESMPAWRPSQKDDKDPDKLCRALVLVQEWAGRGNLLRVMQSYGGKLPETKAINLVLVPLLRCLQYLHDQGIIHRDIKPENLIFDDGMILKMADFGLAVDVNEERANTRAGTLDYMAPEVLMCPTKRSPADHKDDPGARHYNTGADAWGVGAILFELLVGTPPFRGGTLQATARNIMHRDLKFPERMTPGAQDFISECLQMDPSDRPTVFEMLRHPFIMSAQRHSSFRAAARRSNSFIEFIQQQQKLKRQAAHVVPGLSGASGEEEEEEQEEEILAYV